MKNKCTISVQTEQIKDILFSLKSRVTTDDRKAAMRVLNISDWTLSRYLNGYVFNIDTAIKIVGYLNELLQERQKRIQEQIKISIYES